MKSWIVFIDQWTSYSRHVIKIYSILDVISLLSSVHLHTVFQVLSRSLVPPSWRSRHSSSSSVSSCNPRLRSGLHAAGLLLLLLSLHVIPDWDQDSMLQDCFFFLLLLLLKIVLYNSGWMFVLVVMLYNTFGTKECKHLKCLKLLYITASFCTVK